MLQLVLIDHLGVLELLAVPDLFLEVIKQGVREYPGRSEFFLGLQPVLFFLCFNFYDHILFQVSFVDL